MQKKTLTCRWSTPIALHANDEPGLRHKQDKGFRKLVDRLKDLRKRLVAMPLHSVNYPDYLILMRAASCLSRAQVNCVELKPRQCCAW